MKIKLGLSSSIRVGSIGVVKSGGDAVAPTVTITCAQTSPTATSPLNFTFTWSEIVTGFALGDITVGNGSAGNFAGSGAVYTADVTPTAIGTVTVDVAGGVCQDAAGNTNLAATQFSIVYNSLLDVVSYWKLDEASAGAAPVTRVDSKGTNHLTDNNTVPSTTGKISNAASFTAANSESLSITSNATLQTGAVDFTISLWFRFTALGANRGLIVKQNEYDLYFDAGPEAVRWVTAGGVQDVVVPVVDTTYHLIVYRNLTTQKIGYKLNGGVAIEAAAINAITTNANEFTIGRRGAGAFMTGWIDEVGFWKRLLTTAEMNYLYNSGAGVTYPF